MKPIVSLVKTKHGCVVGQSDNPLSMYMVLGLERQQNNLTKQPRLRHCNDGQITLIIMSTKLSSLLARVGVSGVNKPKATPSHPTKSHVVVAKVGDKTKTIRFGQQGVSGSPKTEGESDSDRKRRESFKARHADNIDKGKMSAAYWADKVKW